MLSVCTILAIVSYAAYKWVRLRDIVDYQVTFINEDHYYDSNFTFHDGFAVAAAVTSYDGESQDIEQADIG